MTEFMVDAKEGLSKWQQLGCQAVFSEIPRHATVYHGRKMNIAWAAIFEDAQNVIEGIVNNEVCPQVRFPAEPLASTDSHRNECLAARHAYHYPGCRNEICMNCRKSGGDYKCEIGYFDSSG